MAGKPTSALNFLFQEQIPEGSFWVVYGDDEYLQRLVIQKLRQAWLPQPEDQLNLSEFDGESASWAEVYRELATVSMFGLHPRVVIVNEADSFVSRFRTDLEKWVSQPGKGNILLLSVTQWFSQTRLAKLAAEHGAVIECTFTKRKRPELIAWVRQWAKHRYDLGIDAAAAEYLLESVGTSAGLVDQELKKLAGLGKKTIRVDEIQQLTGTWRTKSVWEILNAALEGNSVAALQELNRLLESGETPLGVLAMMAATLRRYTLATHRYLHPTAEQPRVPLQVALQEAGVPVFAIKNEEERLRRLGRHRAAHLIHWLRTVDAAMKGALVTDPRLLLERLIILLGHPAASRGDLSPISRG